MKILITAFILAVWSYSLGDSFDNFWDIKGAEISSYKVIQPRYGEDRNAQVVLVFVPEDLHLKTRVKVEDFQHVPANEKTRVMKLNRELKFNTGIYNYSVMTSVFSTLAPVKKHPALDPLKISISAHEWCGNYYSHLLPNDRGADRVLHSYFGNEGDQTDYLASPGNELYEDNLPIRIRELKGEFLQVGEKREYHILPTLWHIRISHQPLEYEKGWVKKEYGEKIYINGQHYNTYQWTWQVGDRQLSYWVDRAYPHTILRWEGNDGSSGLLVKTFFKPYWKLKSNQDQVFRKELGIL